MRRAKNEGSEYSLLGILKKPLRIIMRSLNGLINFVLLKVYSNEGFLIKSVIYETHFSICFLRLFPVLMVGRTFSYFGLGLIFWSMGGILGFCFGLILRTSMLAALKEGRKDSIIRGLPKKSDV